MSTMEAVSYVELQGPCELLLTVNRLLGATKHDVKSIKVNDGYQCNVMM